MDRIRWYPFGLAAFLALLCAASCGTPELPEPEYREVVLAFHTGVAALQTSQDVLAREQLERVTELAPMEPAGFANLGVLYLRGGDLEAAQRNFERARELAPDEPAIERLLAISASQRGLIQESIEHWKRALELEPRDLEAGFALARETERLGGPEADAEAQRVLEELLTRSENLAVRIELARIAAKREDAQALEQATAPLDEMSSTWDAQAREQLAALTAAMAQGPREAAPRVMFLKNVLLRVPAYRRALAEVASSDALPAEPLERFLVLANPAPQPAPADEALRFSIRAPDGLPSGSARWVGAFFLTSEEAPVLGVADERTLRLVTGADQPFPGAPAPIAVAASDLNYDFRTDLVLAGSEGVRILRQTPTGGFEDVTASAALALQRSTGPLYGVFPADVDTDGDLDLVLAPMESEPLVLRNNADGTFAEIRPFTGVSRLRGFVWADLDGEGVPDAGTLDAEGRVRIFLNLRGGALRESEAPLAVERAAALAVMEASGDSILDLLVLGAEGSIVRLSFDEVEGRFTAEEIARTTPGGDAATLLAADLDNNGATDLIVGGESVTRVLLGGAEGAFQPLDELPFGARAAADLDGDGRLDLVGLASEGSAAVASSEGARDYHFQIFHPRAATASGDQRINSFGIGGEIELRSGLHVQRKLIDGPAVHFGLGEGQLAEVARVVWPNGVFQSEFDLAGDSTVLATQRLKGSCPWLFAWNGREMAFITDLIWRSPLGLRINAQETGNVLMTEDRVKIEGDQLAPRDGHYDLRVTSELWETQFFDTISLMVVDHPEGTEVFVDERFSVPPPDLAIRVTGPVMEMASVWDDDGRDVSDAVRARDGRHLDFAGRGAYQGVTRDHFVTLELPDEAPRDEPLLLIAQGWVHPTDSSINVAISQGDHPAPRGLSLFVEDADGRFRKVRDGLGFPAGKDKTVLVDLSGLFPSSGPRRLRLSTNMEIFWDRLAVAVHRKDLEPEVREVAAASAELRYRGFSAVEQRDPGSPERPRYELEGTAPRWRDLEGYHTRFGDVRELLAKVDDRYLIMNAGDEIRLLFPEAPPPAPGLIRDYVVMSDGWVKDGDFNTRFSRTVLPLPSHDRASYEAPPGPLEEDPVYRKHPGDFEEYHTRYVTPGRLRDALAKR